MSFEAMPPARDALRFRFRGGDVVLRQFSPRATVLDWLREEMGAKGTKEGCAEGDCGACTVVLARLKGRGLTYEPFNACILLLGQLDGAELITIEDLAAGGELHPLQQAMVDAHASQCGFCTPGIVMSLFAAYHSGEPMTYSGLCDQLAGNLCRCTGYRPIMAAALQSCVGEPADRFAATSQERAAALAPSPTIGTCSLAMRRPSSPPRRVIFVGCALCALSRRNPRRRGDRCWALDHQATARPEARDLAGQGRWAGQYRRRRRRRSFARRDSEAGGRHPAVGRDSSRLE